MATTRKSSSGQPSRRLVPRTAPPRPDAGEVASPPVDQEALALARHKAVLSEALAEAQALVLPEGDPSVVEPASVAKVSKKSAMRAKGKKTKQRRAAEVAERPRLVRDSFTMPGAEYAQIGALKKRLQALDAPARKSELLRAGLAWLVSLDDAALQAALAGVERLKTGRPAKSR